MSKYKNLILILLLIPLPAYYFLSGVWGQSDEPSEFTQEEINKDLVRTALSFHSHLWGKIFYIVGFMFAISVTQQRASLLVADRIQ